MLGPTPIVPDPDVLPALRDLFNQHPTTLVSGSEALSELLFELWYLPHVPEPSVVESAREALIDEDRELLP